MESAVCFRDFEERDIDFIYKCKNNEKLWKYTVGEFHKFSYEEAVGWVHGCMRDDSSYKFWAICKNDETRDIVGWCSIENIDFETKTAVVHGIVIGDREYNDGFTWIETLLFLLKYVFETLCFEKLSTFWLLDHPVSHSLACFINHKLSKTISIEKNGQNYNALLASFSKEDYFKEKSSGNLEMRKIMQRIISYNKGHGFV